jgi:hypothetical protein
VPISVKAKQLTLAPLRTQAEKTKMSSSKNEQPRPYSERGTDCDQMVAIQLIQDCLREMIRIHEKTSVTRNVRVRSSGSTNQKQEQQQFCSASLVHHVHSLHVKCENTFTHIVPHPYSQLRH